MHQGLYYRITSYNVCYTKLLRFNVSTAAAVVAAAGGVRMARHGARALTSMCGTVDLLDALGIDVDCPVTVVGESIDRAGIGIFNGVITSYSIHYTKLYDWPSAAFIHHGFGPS